ncbi:aryl-alcohol oxidase [Mycena floridula]|nr:aryl-alcohol oxidase [Mycena floridula]
MRPLALIAALLIQQGQAAIVDVAQLKISYDFVIVGGGTGGLVVANRLSENPKFNVLVIEAGVSNANVLDSEVPGLAPGLSPNTPYDWNFTTAPQIHLDGRVIQYPRGHLLGGSSSVNYMAYTRGSSEDYDRYASFSGDQGWSWKKMLPYFFKNEVLTPPADHHDTAGEFNPVVHSESGINAVSLPGFLTPSIDNRIISTTGQLSSEFPFNEDMNSGSHLGIGWLPCTIRNGARSSSATSYLAPKHQSRPNLDVLIGNRVTRVLATSSDSGRLTTVEFAASAQDTRQRVKASKEVILSAGAIGSPHVLLHSGIGDSALLSSLGIKTVHHNPGVGQNLSDHVLLPLTWQVNSTDTLDDLNRNATVAARALKQWNETRTGPLVSFSGVNQLGWLRIPDNSSIYSEFADPAAGPNTAHFELLFAKELALQAPPPTGNFITVFTALVAPVSKGELRWKSSDPFVDPIIDPNLLASPFDKFVMRESIRSARRFLQAPTWSNFILASTSTNATSDDDLDTFVRSAASTVFHPTGSASMTSTKATYGVVNPDLKVKGVDGLRVVDASVLPFLPSAHTQVPVYGFAERASDLIKATWA